MAEKTTHIFNCCNRAYGHDKHEEREFNFKEPVSRTQARDVLEGEGYSIYSGRKTSASGGGKQRTKTAKIR